MLWNQLHRLEFWLGLLLFLATGYRWQNDLRLLSSVSSYQSHLIIQHGVIKYDRIMNFGYLISHRPAQVFRNRRTSSINNGSGLYRMIKKHDTTVWNFVVLFNPSSYGKYSYETLGIGRRTACAGKRIDSVSNHQPHDCFLNRLFRCRSKKPS